MRSAIYLHFVITVILYTIVYMITCFVIWEWRNPFEWIIDIPDYKDEARFSILFMWVLYHGIVGRLVYEILKKDKKEEKS